MVYAPNGQIPAYEWNFSDVNPPVHAWAAYRVFKIEKMYGVESLDYLNLSSKIVDQFYWWVNRKDAEGKMFSKVGFRVG